MLNNKMVGIVFFSLFISGCGGGGGSNSHSTESPVSDQSIRLQALPLENRIELGPVAGATVTISTLDRSHILYSTTTDDYGYWKLFPEELMQNMNNLLVDKPDYLLVVSQGGTDIDVDDDGVEDSDGGQYVAGEVKGVYSLDMLMNKEGIATNLISTAVYELLTDKTNTSDDEITYLVQQVGVPDANSDGLVNALDVNSYNMAQDDSSIEEKLRESFLGALHNGDLVQIDSSSSKLSYDFSLVSLSSIVLDDEAIVTLHQKPESSIVYGLNKLEGEPLELVYSGDLSLEKNDYLVFQECVDASCGKIQVVSFDGQSVVRYYQQQTDFPFYRNLSDMNSLRKEIHFAASNDSRPNISIDQVGDELATARMQLDLLNQVIENGGRL